jgi:glycosyltransferase involved in cell wall biosynthesis
MNNPEGQEIIALTKKNRWHNIHFLGWCPQEEIIRHFQNALALIFPSLCYENMPNVVLEAMACGKPVLASNLGSLPELVQHQITGLLATPGQREEFIRCLDWMLTHSHRLVAMGKAARRRIEVDFSTTGHYNALTKIFSHLVEQRRRT